MAELPVEAGVAARLLGYGGAHPFLHFVDVSAGEDVAAPSPADLGHSAVDRMLRRDGYLAYAGSPSVVTLPSSLDGDWPLLPRPGARERPLPGPEVARSRAAAASGGSRRRRGHAC